MPDELDALRQFRDETPGPSTDAWNRARAAVAAARAEEEPARPGRRRTLVIAVGCALAAVAGLVAVLLPGSPGKLTARIETTAFVTRVEHALSASDQRDFVGYARTEYPPGYGVAPIAPGTVRVTEDTGAGSPWSAGSLVRWSYRGVYLISAFSPAGDRIFGLSVAPAGRTLTSTAVLYRSHTWWRGTIGPAAATGAPARCGSRIELGPGGWPTFLRYELGCGEFTRGGRQRIDGTEAVKLTGNGGGQVFWVDPTTYLPVRTVFTTSTGARLQTDFGWLAPTRARLAELRLPVPPGFRQVPAPAQRLGR